MDFTSAIDLVEKVRNESYDASEVVEECFRRIKKLGPEPSEKEFV